MSFRITYVIYNALERLIRMCVQEGGVGFWKSRVEEMGVVDIAGLLEERMLTRAGEQIAQTIAGMDTYNATTLLAFMLAELVGKSLPRDDRSDCLEVLFRFAQGVAEEQ